MTMASIVRLSLCLLLCLGVGAATGSVTAAEIPTWYAHLNQPSWTPPNWAFPVVWTLLYILMAVALWRLWNGLAHGQAVRSLILLFLLQLALNAAWSPVFFLLHRTPSALIIIGALDVVLAILIAGAWRAGQRAVAGLLSPYLAWVLYATTLNAGIVVLNP